MIASNNIYKRSPWNIHRDVLVCLFLVIATVVVYWQVRNHEFVNLDDDKYITENAHVQKGLTRASITWAFSITDISYWHPLTWLSLMLDYEFYGTNPRGYHLTNLVLHIFNALLLFLILRRMTGSLWRSPFVAALFALHPLNVESVAWAVERKNVLSTFFWMLSLLAYSHYSIRPSLPRYLLLALFFGLGLMTKPMLVTLPCVLFLLDYWPLGRLRFDQLESDSDEKMDTSTVTGQQRTLPYRLILEKVPLLLLSGIAAYVTSLSAQQIGMAISTEAVPMKLRIANGLVSYVAYGAKMVWPKDLAVFYPYPSDVPIWQSAGAAALLVGISLLIFRAVRKAPYLVTGWFWYLGTLVPVIGLKQGGLWPAMADRFAYVPLIGLFIMIAWGAPDLLAKWTYRRITLAISAGVVLLILMICTRVQVSHWRNNFALFGHALNVTKNNYVAHNSMGNVLMQQGKIEEAIGHFSAALRINSNSVETYNNLGVALLRQGKVDEAIIQYTKALQFKSDYAETYNNLGVALVRRGELDKAVAHYLTALKLEPNYEEPHNNLGNLLAQQGRLEDAIAHYDAALQIRANYAEAHNNLGVAHARQGKIDKAIANFSEALRLEPGYVQAKINLSIALQEAAKVNGALESISKP